MIATNFSNVRNNFKEVCERVVQDSDIAIITRKNGENVVLMSQVQYDNLMENFHIRDSKTNYEWIKDSVRQAENGRLIKFEVETSYEKSSLN
ncbi:MAG: type II toxin-antitoxin system prevent-host-death family antitoxin [bacterium]|nr:type II toxin-antitoxin system prevent-host-death family antitoxin [bacterium]